MCMWKVYTYLFVIILIRSIADHVEQDNDQKETDDKSKSKQHIDVCIEILKIILYNRNLYLPIEDLKLM